MLDIEELIRRLRAGQAERSIGRDLVISRNTIAGYRELAKAEGWLEGPLPEPAQIQAVLAGRQPAEIGRQISKVEPYRELVEKLLGLPRPVESQAIYGILVEQGFSGSYGGVLRFVRQFRRKRPETFIRVEVPPGEQAQVDFGFAGWIPDGYPSKPRKAWVFVMTLSASRHQYVELVWDQSVATWLKLHQSAFEFFGGVPRQVVLDNLKAAIVRASIYEPEVQRSYRELAVAYGFVISPCRPRTPEHKGKVESGVHYVKRNCLAGRTFPSLEAANEHAKRWVFQTAGRRSHGTTYQQPLEVFEKLERPALLPLPEQRYELAVWKKAKLSRDNHLFFEKSFYSAPFRLVGRELWLKGTPTSVAIYDEWEVVALHPTQKEPGRFSTHPDHLPPEKRGYLEQTPDWCRQKAAAIGPKTEEVVEELLGERPLDRLPTARAILRLARKFATRRLEAACARALAYGEVRYRVIKNILERGLDRLPETEIHQQEPVPSPAAPARFARHITEFFPEPEEGDPSCSQPLN